MTCDDLSFFSALTQLRKLELISCCTPVDVNQFAFLTELTVLEMSLSRSCDESFVVSIISKLVNLSKFTIYSDHYLANKFRLNMQLLSDIINIVKGRRKELTLRCRVDQYIRESIKNGEKYVNVRVDYFSY